MNDVPRRRSLESARKEAKRWLAALHQQDPAAIDRLRNALPDMRGDPTLRDTQHALAREAGYAGWTELSAALREHEAAAVETLALYQGKADALLEAYQTGTPDAMQRHWQLTWHRRAWSGMRTYVQLDLGKIPGPEVEITGDDARWLIAREHGFASWDVLARAVSHARSPREMLSPLDVFRDDPRRTTLNGHGRMTDEMLRQVSAMKHLTELRLGGSGAVTDTGVAALAGLVNLRVLDLSGTAVTDQGVRALSGLHALEQLSLAWTRVSDAGAAAFAGCMALAHVDLSGSACGDGALRTFAGKPRLRVLRTGSATSDAGLALLHEYPVFKHWAGGEVEMGLTSYDDGANALMLRGTITDRGLLALRGLDGLFGLDIDDAALPITGQGLAPLLDLPKLGRLSVDAKDDAMPLIARLPQLRFLGCQDTTASDAGWVALARSRSIESIWGRRCYGLSDEGFRALGRMPSLAKLSVSCRNVSDAAVATLPAFPALRELMPMDIPDAGYRHIGECKELESLVLMYCRDTTDAATEHLVLMPRLQKYFASYTRITDRTPALLAQIPSLEEVTFDSCAGLTDAGIAELAVLPRLRAVRVSGRQLTPMAIGAFPEHVITTLQM